MGEGHGAGQTPEVSALNKRLQSGRAQVAEPSLASDPDMKFIFPVLLLYLLDLGEYRFLGRAPPTGRPGPCAPRVGAPITAPCGWVPSACDHLGATGPAHPPGEEPEPEPSPSPSRARAEPGPSPGLWKAAGSPELRRASRNAFPGRSVSPARAFDTCGTVASGLPGSR